MAANTLPWIKPQFFTNTGAVAAGYKLFSYITNTATKLATYTTSALTTANANPIILDAYGRASIFLGPSTYTFVLAPPTDSDPPVAPLWTANDIAASATLFTSFDINGVAGESLALNDVVYLSDGSGGNAAGYWFRTDANEVFSSLGAIEIGVAQSAASVSDSVAVRLMGQVTGLSGLTVGAPYYVGASAGTLTNSAPSNPIIVGVADSTTSLILAPQYGLASATVRGLISIGAQTLAGLKTFQIQPQVYGGTSITLPGTVGGVFGRDVAAHQVTTGTLHMSSFTIPANMLDMDGKTFVVYFGSSAAMTGTGTKIIGYGMTNNSPSGTIYNSTTNLTSWWCRLTVKRAAVSSGTFCFIRTTAEFFGNTGFAFDAATDTKDIAIDQVYQTIAQIIGTGSVDQTFAMIQAIN